MHPQSPATPGILPEDMSLARSSFTLLEQHVRESPQNTLSFVCNGTALSLPHTAVHALLDALQAIGQGKDVMVLPAKERLTPQQAADILHVSRPFVDRILEQGLIPFDTAGKHRRIKLEDLRHYQLQQQQATAKLDELSALTQTWGLE